MTDVLPCRADYLTAALLEEQRTTEGLRIRIKELETKIERLKLKLELTETTEEPDDDPIEHAAE